jgi:hypothetical protein
MESKLAIAMIAAWIPLTAVLFRAIGPRNASLVGVFGGFILLPSVGLVLGPVPFDKRVAIGLGLVLGILLFDRQALARFRPRWPDVFALAFAIDPLRGIAAGAEFGVTDPIDLFLQRGLGWFLPYVAGRIYFAGKEGPRRVAEAAVIAGLVTVPACIYEEIAGPGLYLSERIFGTSHHAGMVGRLGGWRPEVFQVDGLELATWMALTASTATWLAMGPSIRRPWATRLSAAVLVVASVSCRGIFGYITLGLALGVALATRAARTRTFILLLAALPVAYVAVRASGLWDARSMVEATAFTGRSSSLGFRIEAEGRWLDATRGLAPWTGTGIYVWHAPPRQWPDGQWLRTLYTGGALGLVVSSLAAFLLPAGLALSKPARRPTGPESIGPAWALATWCLLAMIDQLFNSSPLSPTALIAGSLVHRDADADEAGRPVRWESVLYWVALASVVLALDAIGQASRHQWTPKP